MHLVVYVAPSVITSRSLASTMGCKQSKHAEIEGTSVSAPDCATDQNKRVVDAGASSESYPDLSISDETWSGDDVSETLLVRFYRPLEVHLKDERLPAILDAHGGMWNKNDRTLDRLTNCALARAGYIVAAFDFRQGPNHKHPTASLDVTAALVWLRKNSDRLKLDPNRIGLMGTSSGGHLAMYAGITPNSNQHRIGDERQIKPPKFLMALWPVSDPLARYRYAKRAKIERLVEAHEKYFCDEDAMREASVPRVVASGEAESLPPLLLVHPGEDGNVPLDITMDLIKAWQSRDGYLEYAFFPGEPHAFGLQDSSATQRLAALIVDFAKRHS